MLTKEFLCKREVLGKRSPHSFTPPPPPLSVVGVSNNLLISYVMILKEKNHVMMLARRKILKILQMKVKNLQRLLIALIQNVMMLNFSQVKKMI
jgi:hypothetical protein